MLGIAFIGVLATTSCSQGTDTPVADSPDTSVADIASPTDPVVTSPPTSNIDKDVPEAGQPQAEIVDIFVDTADPSVQEASVLYGSQVNIRVRSATPDEFHLHGYDLELEGTDVSFSFSADQSGDFVLEGHNSGRQLLILTVFQD